MTSQYPEFFPQEEFSPSFEQLSLEPRETVIPEQETQEKSFEGLANRERTFLERFLKRPRAWAAVSAFVLTTSIT